MNNKQDFLKHVDRYTDMDESVLGDLLNIVTQKFNRMVEHEKNRRDSIHFKSARDLLDQLWHDNLYDIKNAKLFDNITCCNIMDSMASVYPNCDAGSVAGKELLEHYAKSTRALGWKPDDSFIKDIREKSEWFEKLYTKY